MSAVKRAIILMADSGHEPTETVAPFVEFKKAGFEVTFATAKGKVAECDDKMLQGWTQKLLGASSEIVKQHKQMKESKEYNNPLSWQKEGFDLKQYNVVWIPGGHAKGIRQIIEDTTLHAHLAAFLEICKTDQKNHCLAAICHGPVVLSSARGKDGKSLVYDAKMTALPAAFEGPIYQLTRYFLGDYYKTYGAGSPNVEEMIRKEMRDDSKQWQSSILPTPFIVEDDNLGLVTGRYPADAVKLATKAVQRVS